MKSSNPPRERRVLIDECLPVQLRHIFPGHDVRTVMHMAWRSLKDSELLSAAEGEGFDVFLTADAAIPRNHDLTGWHLAVVVIPTNRRKIVESIAPLLRKMVDEVARVTAG
jgi:predicted nuclease of predicted toxin-antitoxin system